MRFKIQREVLLKPLQLVSGVVERKQTLPILSHVLLDVRDQQLTVVATDIEVELQGSIAVDTEIKQGGSITISGKKFLDICRAIPEGDEIEIYDENNRIIIVSGRSRFTLATLPASEFPRFQMQDGILEFTIPQQILRSLIEQTVFAVPQQDIRQYLNGLLLEIKDGTIQVIATDGHRLALGSSAASVVDNSFAQIIVPRKGVVELLKLLGDAAGDAVISLNNNNICIKGPGFVLFSKLINTKFPNYNKIIPKHGDKHFEISREEFKQALTRVGVLSTELFRSVRFQLRAGSLRLITNNPEQEEAIEDITIDYNGEDLDTMFNISYFLDIMNCISTEKLAVFLKDAESGVIIEEVGGEDNFLYVIMPIK
jgi:DNA polymerase III subunit beta